MPENNKDILTQLQSLQIEPPVIFDKIWQAISNNEQSGANIILADASSTISDKKENSGDIHIIESLKALQDYELAAPPFNFKAISGAEKVGEITKPLVVVHTKRSFSLLYKLVAAVFVTTLAVWVVYTITQQKKIDSVAIVEKNPIINNAGVEQKKIDSNINVATSSLNKSNTAQQHINRIRIKNNIPVLTSDAQWVKVDGNDLFLTLVNYNYYESSVFLRNNKKTQKVKLDQFSYVTVSDNMADILKKMYATKKNKKPTWKAKRVKAKLRKWKKQDEKNFDRKANQNPIDVIDLSEFIFK